MTHFSLFRCLDPKLWLWLSHVVPKKVEATTNDGQKNGRKIWMSGKAFRYLGISTRSRQNSSFLAATVSPVNPSVFFIFSKWPTTPFMARVRIFSKVDNPTIYGFFLSFLVQVSTQTRTPTCRCIPKRAYFDSMWEPETYDELIVGCLEEKDRLV